MKFHPAKWKPVPWCVWANFYGKMFWFGQELEDLETEHKAASDLFEKQKEEAMATMKKSEDLKSLRLAKSQTRCNLAMPQSTFLKWKRRHTQGSAIILRWIFLLVSVTHCKSAQVDLESWHDFSEIDQLKCTKRAEEVFEQTQRQDRIQNRYPQGQNHREKRALMDFSPTGGV